MKDLIETERSMIDVLNNKTIILIIYSKKDMLKLKKKKKEKEKKKGDLGATVAMTMTSDAAGFDVYGVVSSQVFP